MTNSKELVARLHEEFCSCVNEPEYKPIKCYVCEAANIIEAQAAEIERLKEEIDTWQSVFPDIMPESVLPDRSLVEAEVVRLTAQLARMKEALTKLASFGYATDEKIAIARRALGEP